MVTAMTEAHGGRAGVDRPWRLVWAAFAFFLAAVVLGFGWDRAWHTTHPFEDFWSPPHRFIYTTLALAGFTVWRIVLADELLPRFGPVVRLPLVGVRLPGPLLLAGGGLVAVGAAGAFDSIWHTSFGLDETGWSFPHALLGWGTLLTFLGLVSCRLALARERPLGRLTVPLLELLGLLWTSGVVLGPLDGNRTAELVRRIAALPVLAAEPNFQHTARIYLAWRLDRTGALFLPLAAFAVGAALGLARGLTDRPGTPLVLALLATLFTFSRRRADFFGLADDPRTWLPLPFLPAALAFLAARQLGLRAVWSWALAGVAAGGCVALVWGQSALLVPLAVLALSLGAAVGAWMARVVRSPDARGVTWLLGATFAVPLFTGCVDLYVRWHTA
jgi:hypothetical protein